MKPDIDFRIQGISHAAVEQKKSVNSIVHQIKNHPNKDALIADLHNNDPYNPFSESEKR